MRLPGWFERRTSCYGSERDPEGGDANRTLHGLTPTLLRHAVTSG